MSKDKKSNYYDKGGIETIDIIKAKLTPEQFNGYLLGNAIKYACRLNFKDNVARDAEKMANYSQWLVNQFNPCQNCDRDYDYITKIGEKHHG